MANERDRSKVVLFNPNAKTENYIRSNHDDFATSAELKDRKFSGWRANSLTQSTELWVNGEVVKTVTQELLNSDPVILEKIHAEYFGII